MSTIQLNAGDFERASRLFKNSRERCVTLEANIKNYTENLLSSWQGESKKAFEKEYRTLEKGMSNYKDLLTEIADELSKISSVFTEADETIRRSLSGN